MDEPDAYPPPPWRLHGDGHLHLFLVPQARMPATASGFRPLIVGGRGVAIAGWFDYQGGSIVRYRELFAAVVGFAGVRPSATVTHMWVDSPASRRGGRELWGYPKELATFDLDLTSSGRATASAEGLELATGAYRPRLTLPVPLIVRAGTVQPFQGGLRRVRMRARFRPSIGTGSMRMGPHSPLAFLAGARRVASFGIGDFQFRFGHASDGMPAADFNPHHERAAQPPIPQGITASHR